MATKIPFAPGARVAVRDEEWVVRSVKSESSGGHQVKVVGVSELVRGSDAIFLSELDEIEVLRPEDTTLVSDVSSRYANTRLYLESLFRRSPVTDAAIHLGHRAAITPADYQLRPTARALSLPRPRFLMADAVGLGKTIEVGVFLTEMIRRGRGDRILVVAMKSILAQFQKELWGRFTIPLVRLDSVGIQRVQAKIPTSMNPFHRFDRVIVSVDTLKNDVKYRQHLENCRWDVIVVDECQNVAMRTKGGRGQGSQRAQLAKLLANQCDSLIFTSATPHDGSAQSFASLIRLLEPTAIADEDDFTPEEVGRYFQRKFKKDVDHEIKDAFPEREMRMHHLPASTDEDAFIELLHGSDFQTIGAIRGSGKVLFRTTLLKAFLSSPHACISTINKRLKHKDMDLEEQTGEKLEAARADHEFLLRLRSLAESVATSKFPKYAALIEQAKLVLAKDKGKARLVIFSESIPTLEFLRDALSTDCKLKWSADQKAKNQIEIFHGSLDDKSQMDLVESFGNAGSPLRILLASDAAAEGINLHYQCNHLIHFDLPWSLMTLVQRNGRIDRFGQTKTPRISYLLTVPSDPKVQGDLRVLDRLAEKEVQVQKNLGDAAWLMNLHSSELEVHEIALAAQGSKSAEEVLPDEPRQDDEDDWLGDILGADEAHEVQLTKMDRDSLFETDLDFAREAFEATGVGQDDEVLWQDDLDGFDLVPPPDLVRRYELLPPELIRKKNRFRLTTDRKRVTQSIELARQKEREWPEWELFWPQHPICEWLDDRVLSALGRHEAWVVRVPEGLGDDDSLFLFQGICFNKLSQSQVVEWFAVPFQGGKPQPVISRDDALLRSGLRDVKGNPGNESVSASLSPLRAVAVDKASEHMKDLRKSRAAEIGKPLREGMRALSAWHDKSLKRLDLKRLAATKAEGKIPTVTRRRIEQEEHDVNATFEERKRWVKRLKTVPEPYLRLAAVFVRADLS